MPSGYRILFTTITACTLLTLGLWYYEMRIHFGFKIAVVTTLLFYLVVPCLYHFSVTIQQHLVFLPFVRWPYEVNFSNPESEGMPGTRNFYLDSEAGIALGVWHVLPRTLVASSSREPPAYWEEMMRTSGKPVVVYMHGNTASRASAHRKELYLLLQDLDYHVLALDYRGYADSTMIAPTETGVVTDARALYKYAKKIVGDEGEKSPPIFVWGHSLGTGVSSHLVADLCIEGDRPKGLVLESPFTSIGEEVKYHALAAIYRYIPYFESIFVKPLHRNDIAFQSDKHISKIDVPILIMHATDDAVIPFDLGVKLFRIALRTRDRSARPVYFKHFGEGHEHKFICRSPDLPDLVQRFFNSAISDRWPCPGFDNAEYAANTNSN